MRKEVQYVFLEVTRGDLKAFFKVLHYVNNRRGEGPQSRGSQPVSWYVGKKPSLESVRYKYMYD